MGARLLPFVLCCVVLADCTCGEALTELVPDIAVGSDEVVLARQIVGASVAASLQVGNRGTGVLRLQARVEPGDEGFTIDDAPDTIAPKDAARVTLAFRPAERRSYAAELVLTSNDPDEREVRVPLSGEGGPPLLDVDPLAVDFGLVNQGVAVQRVVTISNLGFDSLTQVTATLEQGSVFSIDATALPTELAPGASAPVLLLLTPDEASAAQEDGEGLLHDALLVGSDDGDARVDVRAGINLAPVAVAVEQLTRQHSVKVGVGKPVLVDGSDSADPEGDAITLSWSLTQRPASSFTALVPQGDTLVGLTPDAVGSYTVQLTVTDVHGASGADQMVLLPRDLEVVLRWSTDSGAACQAFDEAECAALPANERDDVCCGQSDLDLHLLRPEGTLGDVGACPGGCAAADCVEQSDAHVDTCRQTGTDCSWANRAPEWNAAGRADDPRLDVDDVRGFGPEITSVDIPEDGAYRAVIHYCSDRIGEPTLATVDVFVEGVLAHSAGPELLQQGDAWTATTLLRADGAWSFVSPPGVVDAAPPGLCEP